MWTPMYKIKKVRMKESVKCLSWLQTVSKCYVLRVINSSENMSSNLNWLLWKLCLIVIVSNILLKDKYFVQLRCVEERAHSSECLSGNVCFYSACLSASLSLDSNWQWAINLPSSIAWVGFIVYQIVLHAHWKALGLNKQHPAVRRHFLSSESVVGSGIQQKSSLTAGLLRKILLNEDVASRAQRVEKNVTGVPIGKSLILCVVQVWWLQQYFNNVNDNNNDTEASCMMIGATVLLKIETIALK